MSEIIELDSHRPHTTTSMLCVCGQRWQSVYPLGTEALECPSCSKMCVPPITDYLTDAEFREKYEPLVGHFVSWRRRIAIVLGLDKNESMETLVAHMEEFGP